MVLTPVTSVNYSNVTFVNVTVLRGIVTTVSTNTVTNDNTGSSHVLAYVLIPLGSLILVTLIAFVVMMIFRKNRLDRLRHHLMPLYNFDPQEEDWESELLDDRGRKVSYREANPSPTSPKLKFNA